MAGSCSDAIGGCSIQSRCLLTINPVAAVASFEVCAVGSGIKGGSSRRLSMSCLVDNHAACSTFKGGFGRHQAQASSMVAILPIMILGGEISSCSLQKEATRFSLQVDAIFYQG
ncbi:hypothetical protein M0R45_017811 [Rubus argutus]|uniref:Uncharacterized protein n=1 Tax=Rubus argutus TaxID=59490 RepID=A0AAW1Y031_RUBAR